MTTETTAASAAVAFDFDAWSRLAREDAAAFERQRQALIERALEAAPPDLRQRLRGLQFRIDMERARAATPLAAAVRLNAMMWSKFIEWRDACAGVTQKRAAAPRPPAATLIPFPGRR